MYFAKLGGLQIVDGKVGSNAFAFVDANHTAKA